MTRVLEHEDRGTALFLVVGLLAVLSVMSATFYAGVHRQLRSHHVDEARIEALHIAEGGIHFAIARLADDRGFRGEDNVPLGEGAFNVSTSPLAGAAQYRIVSTGIPSRELTDNRIVCVEAAVAFGNGPPQILTWRRVRAGER